MSTVCLAVFVVVNVGIHHFKHTTPSPVILRLVEESVTALVCLLEWLWSQTVGGKMGKKTSQYFSFVFLGLANNVLGKEASFGVRITFAGYWCTSVTGLLCLASRSQPTCPVALSDCLTLYH